MKVVSEVFALMPVWISEILSNFLRVTWWIVSICFAYVDWPQLWSMDFDFNWGDSEQVCSVFDILSNLTENLLDSDVGTLREIHAKCVCKKFGCVKMPIRIVKQLPLSPYVELVYLLLKGNSMLFFVSVCFKICRSKIRDLQSLVAWVKTRFRRDLAQSVEKACSPSDGAESVEKACSGSDGAQSVEKACSRSDGAQSKLSDGDFNKIIQTIKNALNKRSHLFDEGLKRRMSDLLLCVPDCSIGTRWHLQYINEGEIPKGIEIVDPELFSTINGKMRFSGRGWSELYKEKITLDHYVKFDFIAYYPRPFVFGEERDLKPILGALDDVAFRVELEKQPDLYRDILAVHASQH